MSILVKNMKMPKGCSFCKMKEQNRHGQCSITGTEWENDTMILLNFDSDKERLSDCPLAELPEKHGRLVEFIDVATETNDDTGLEEINLGEALSAYLKMRESKPVIEAEGKG